MTDISGELIIPVYLNQRVVFDLIAMLQGGISTVTRITSTESNLEKDQKDYGAAFGLSKAFSTLLRIDLSGTRQKAQEDSKGFQKSDDRVHTPASLFQVLRANLTDRKELIVVDKDYTPKIRDIIEFTAQLRRNSLIQTMDVFIGLMEMATVFSGKSAQPPKLKGPKTHDQDDNKRIKDQMGSLLKGLKSGGTIDIISDTLKTGTRAVITLETEFLNDPTMSDLVDGEFNVLGKVVRVIDNNQDSISLVRKTVLSAMPVKLMNEAFSKLSELSGEQKLNIPPLEIEIKGPVIQVLPIAIFA